MDLLQHMGTFVRIAEAGSISKAARRLRLSVAMTSRHLRALEEHLGVELIRRTTRNLALTEAGAEFLTRSRALLSEAEDARAAVRPERGPVGLVVVSMPVSFGMRQVAPLFYALLDRHPRLKFDLRFEDRFVDLLSDGVDLAIRAGFSLPDSPFIVARRLTTMERVLCASRAYLAKHGEPDSMAALGRHSCLVQGEGPARWRYETAEGSMAVTVEGRVRSNNLIAIREAALADQGIALLPRWLVHDDLRAERLVTVLSAVTLPAAEVSALFHKGSRGTFAIRAIVDFLAAELPPRMAAWSAPTRPARSKPS